MKIRARENTLLHITPFFALLHVRLLVLAVLTPVCISLGTGAINSRTQEDVHVHLKEKTKGYKRRECLKGIEKK